MDAPVLLRARARRSGAFAGLTVALALAVPSAAWAQSTAALVFRGDAPQLEAQVADALLEVFLAAPSATQAQLTRNWEGPPLARLSERTVERLKRVLEIADASGVDVIIAAEVEKKGKRRRAKPVRLRLAAIRVDDGRVLLDGQARIGGRGRRRGGLDTPAVVRFLRRAADRMESGATESSEVAPAAEAPAAPAEDDGASPAPPPLPATPDEPAPAVSEAAPTAEIRASVPAIRRERWTRADRTLEVETFGLVHGRSFRYYDTVTRNLREFDSGVSYGVGARIEVYPLSVERRSGTTRRIGLVGGYARDFGIQPTVADAPGVRLEHTWTDWFAGAGVAWDFSTILLRSQLTFGENRSRFTAPEDFAARRELPSARYQTLSVALDARYETSFVSYLAGAQYSFIRQAGRVGDALFPNAAVGGLRVRAGVSAPLYSSVEVFAAGVYDHFFYDMRSQRGDEFLAGGALDLQLTGELGVGYAF